MERLKTSGRFQVFHKTWMFGFSVFLLGLIVRTLPELLSGPYPIGFDVLAGYVPSILSLPGNSALKVFGWAWSPLAVYLLWTIRTLTNTDVYFLMKLAGPVFYGFFTVSFYYLLRQGLKWNQKKSFVTALIFLLQPAVLRIGWDQFREELGLIFLFVLLAKTDGNLVNGSKTKSLLTLALSVLIVLSHQLVAVLMFIVVLWQLVRIAVNESKIPSREIALMVPAGGIFVWQLYSQFVNPEFSVHFAPIQLPTGSSIFLFSNYFLSDPRFLDGNYLKLLAYVGSLSLYIVVPLIPLAVRGFFKDRIFLPIVVWLSFASYSVVFFPTYSLSVYWWWIFLLPIPLTVYVGQGLENLRAFSDAKRWKVTVCGVLLLSFVAVGYASSAVRIGYPYAYYYMPSGLVESSIPFQDIPRVEETLIWVNRNVPANASVIVPEKLQGLAYVHLRSDLRIRVAPSLMNLSDVLKIPDLELGATYGIYYQSEVGSQDNIEILTIISNLCVLRVG